jgi:hypothetical protein
VKRLPGTLTAVTVISASSPGHSLSYNTGNAARLAGTFVGEPAS